MISISVAGGVPIKPPHSTLPSQSPVSQAGFQLDSNLQPVRAHIRPDHDHGAVMGSVWPDGR